MSERYEPTDLESRSVARVGGWLAGTLLAIFLLIYLFLHVMKSMAPPVHPSGFEPPLPRLQSNPTLDLAEFRAREESKLHTYRWLNRQDQSIAIPIDHAINLTLERGLPCRPQP